MKSPLDILNERTILYEKTLDVRSLFWKLFEEINVITAAYNKVRDDKPKLEKELRRHRDKYGSDGDVRISYQKWKAQVDIDKKVS